MERGEKQNAAPPLVPKESRIGDFDNEHGGVAYTESDTDTINKQPSLEVSEKVGAIQELAALEITQQEIPISGDSNMGEGRREGDGEGGVGGGVQGVGGDREVAIRAHNNAWVVIRGVGGDGWDGGWEEVVTVLERGWDTLVGASLEVDRVCNR